MGVGKRLKRILGRLIERPPRLFRLTVPGGLFRVPGEEKTVYLTFDDGPVPEATPMVLDILDRYGVKATFFMVGENVWRHPELLAEVKRRGHAVGNHTYHHLQGAKVTTLRYMQDVMRSEELRDCGLFRPPHGWLRPRQTLQLRRRFLIVMYDLVSRDYSRHLTAEEVAENVKCLARPGSIIVFHDSKKSLPRLEKALTSSLEWLISEGYGFRKLRVRNR